MNPLRSPIPLPLLPAAPLATRPALAWRGDTINYRALADRADDLARRLAGLGIGRGDRVALLLPNRPLFVALVHALARLEAIAVPLNTRLTADEVAWQVADADPRALVCAPSLADRLAGIDSDVRLIVAPDDTGDDVEVPAFTAGAVNLNRLTPTAVALVDVVEPDLPQSIVYTSGTTGRPKGAVLTHGNQLWGALASALRLGLLPDDRWLAPLPLFHVGGMAVALRCARYGTTVVLHDRFDPDAVARALQRERIALVSLVPTMLSRVLDVWGDEPAPAHLRAVLLGGAPASPALLARASALGLPLAPTYGLTEAASQVATTFPSPEAGPGHGVPPMPFTEIRVVDDRGVDTAPDGEGEILVRGPTVMTGYWNAPEATSAALADGWLHTGDIGRLDEHGRLHVSGRRDDLIVSGGENVYPAEVEAVLEAHPAVAESCVVGLPDADWGALVAAAVVPVAGAEATAEDLDAHARGLLAGYKVPRRYLWLESLPRTAAGKPKRPVVRQRLLGRE